MHLLKNGFWLWMTMAIILQLEIGVSSAGYNRDKGRYYILYPEDDISETGYGTASIDNDVNFADERKVQLTQYPKHEETYILNLADKYQPAKHNKLHSEAAKLFLALNRQYLANKHGNSTNVLRNITNVNNSDIQRQPDFVTDGMDTDVSETDTNFDNVKRAAKVRKQRFFSWGGKRSYGIDGQLYGST